MQPGKKASWDDVTHSASVACTCASGDCSADYAKVVFRLFADPAFRKTGGGPKQDIACTPSASGCSGSLPRMPAKWGGRVSAVALLYDSASYTLPKPK